MSEAQTTEILVVYWEWSDGPHKGARFWGAHGFENDGRLRDWPQQGLTPLGAAKVSVVIGEGLETIRAAAAADANDPERAVAKIVNVR